LLQITHERFLAFDAGAERRLWLILENNRRAIEAAISRSPRSPLSPPAELACGLGGRGAGSFLAVALRSGVWAFSAIKGRRTLFNFLAPREDDPASTTTSS